MYTNFYNELDPPTIEALFYCLPSVAKTVNATDKFEVFQTARESFSNEGTVQDAFQEHILTPLAGATCMREYFWLQVSPLLPFTVTHPVALFSAKFTEAAGSDLRFFDCRNTPTLHQHKPDIAFTFHVGGRRDATKLSEIAAVGEMKPKESSLSSPAVLGEYRAG